MAAILRQQFVVDPRVKGTMTLYSEKALAPHEAYLNYLAALRGQGYTVVEVGGLFKVVPEADAKLQSGTVSVGDVNRRGDQVLTQIYRLTHENANNLVPVLRPADQPQQHHQREPRQQHAGDHRLRRQPAAHWQDHRRDGHACGGRCRRHHLEARGGQRHRTAGAAADRFSRRSGPRRTGRNRRLGAGRSHAAIRCWCARRTRRGWRRSAHWSTSSISQFRAATRPATSGWST